MVVPDNLKDAVRLASFYEPDINPSYLISPATTISSSFPPGCANLGTRPRWSRPSLQVERQVMAPLRNRTFFSLAEANAAFRRADSPSLTPGPSRR